MTDTLSDRLRDALQRHRLKQKDFAEVAGLKPLVISNVLLGRDPRYSTGVKIENAIRKLNGDHANRPA